MKQVYIKYDLRKSPQKQMAEKEVVDASYIAKPLEKVYTEWQTEEGLPLSEGCVKEIQTLQTQMTALDQRIKTLETKIVSIEKLAKL